jgi:hypothetical protein
VVAGGAAEQIADAWSCATVAERHGIVIACCEGPLRYIFADHTLFVTTFAPSWAVAVAHPAPFRAAGSACFMAVAVAIAKELPAALISQLMSVPTLRPRLIHITTAPPEITFALEVARPDLYWLVAVAWHAIKCARGASMDWVCKLTRDVTHPPWAFDCGSRAYADLALMVERMHVVLVQTAPAGTEDLVLDGAGKLSCSPRDKMLLAIALLWGQPTRWLDTLPPCAPAPLAQFRNTLYYKIK